MNTNLLMESFGHVDDDVMEKYFKIQEALKMKKAAKTKSHWLKWSAAVAACFCVILSIAIIVPSFLNSNNIETPDVEYHLGNNATTKYGTITLTESNRADGNCRFVFEKTTDDLLGFAIRGYIEDERYVDENGVEKVKPIQYHIITPYSDYEKIIEVASNHIVLDNQLKLLVNGQEVSEFPSAPGTYEITVDYSALYELLDYVEPAITVFGFGDFVLE